MIGQYCQGGAIPAGAFAHCQVPLTALGATASSHLEAIIFQEGAGRTLPPMYFDELGLSAAAPPAPPTTPTGLAISAQATAVTLTWQPVSSASGYLLSRAAAQAGPFSLVTASALTGTTYVDTAVVSGSTYWYEVAAENGAGSSADSAPVSATVPLPPPPPTGSSTFTDPMLWSGVHAATMSTGGTTVWWNADVWDARGDAAYNAVGYLNTLVQQEKGFHLDVHKADSTYPASAMPDNVTYAVGGDGSQGLGTMHLDFEDILSARLRNPMLIASETQPGVVTFTQTRFVTTGHWWEVAITPADRVTAGEWTSVPAANAGLAGPFGTGYAVQTTLGVGNGHTPPEDSVNFVFQGYPDVPCALGWHVHPELKATVSGITYDVWTPVTTVDDLPPTDPSELATVYHYRLEYRPSGVDLYADWDTPGVLTLRGHYAFNIPWTEVHVQLLAVAYQADHHPQAPCYQGQVRELHWTDIGVAPVKYMTTSVAPSDSIRTPGSTESAWLGYDLRDIQRYGGPTSDGLPLPNPGPYDLYGSMGYASFMVWASAVSPSPVQAIDLSVNVTAAQASAAAAQFLYDIRYTGTATLSINGVVVGTLPAASTVPAAAVESSTYATIWVRRGLSFNPALLHAGTNSVHLALSGQVGLDRMQLEFMHAQ